MARLESQAKAGFYPTPDTICDLLQTKINYEDETRLLDPCCGKGKTLSRLAKSEFELTTYGIELDHRRANKARSRLTKVLWGDALTEVRLSPAAFGLLYLNPPYDIAGGQYLGGKSQRMETLFLRRYLGALQLNGYLVLVIPYYILQYCAKTLSRYFTLQVLAFPEDSFQRFKQCVVIGRKKMLVLKDQAETTEFMLQDLAKMEPKDFLDGVSSLEDMTPVTVPAPLKVLETFKAKKTDPLEAIPRIRKAGILQNILEELAPNKNNKIRPLTPLENGHMALMLAGGYMNGAIEKDGRQLVIKGVVHKSEKVINVREDDSGKGSITTKDQYIPTVKVIDMQTAELITVQ